MHLILAFAIGFVGLTTLGVRDGQAQPSSVLEKLKGANPHEVLSGPTQYPSRSDDVRNLSAAPSTAPADGADVIGRSREISPAERQELLQGQTRQSPSEWSGDRN